MLKKPLSLIGQDKDCPSAKFLSHLCMHLAGTDLGGGAKGAAAPPFVYLLIINHIIHCYTHYFNLQAGVKIVIITIINIITSLQTHAHAQIDS